VTEIEFCPLGPLMMPAAGWWWWYRYRGESCRDPWNRASPATTCSASLFLSLRMRVGCLLGESFTDEMSCTTLVWRRLPSC
jgi:hypothetical protein